MTKPKLMVFLVAVAASGAASAQVPHTFAPGTPAKAAEVNANFSFLAARPQVIWKRSPTCDNPCTMTATSLRYPNADGYTTIASLGLPPGSWLLSGKLSAYAVSDILYGDLQCVLGKEGGQEDFSSVGLAPLLGGQKHLGLQVPFVTTDPTTTVRLGCKLFGARPDGTTLIDAQVWGARILALQVASVVEQ
jgi:hypothetical protein